jgi:hypothetical protein
VVERFFDTLAVHQAGYPAVVGLMGSTLSRCQTDLLTTHFDRVDLMLDGADAGRLGAMNIAQDARRADVGFGDLARERPANPITCYREKYRASSGVWNMTSHARMADKRLPRRLRRGCRIDWRNARTRVVVANESAPAHVVLLGGRNLAH